jgi:radical SAM protein with 4Fe4S-binding SPASM domain
MALGHVKYGIAANGLRDQFIYYQPKGCQSKECYENTPCRGGCPGVNYDLTGDIWSPAPQLCRYVEMQMKVSKYLEEKSGGVRS